MTLKATYVHDGHKIDYTPNAAVAAGAIVLLGSMVCVAPSAIAANALGALAIGGVWDVAKITGAIAAGAGVFWKAAGDPVGGTAGSGAASGLNADGLPMGVAVAAAGSSDTTVRVRLNPSLRTVCADVTLDGSNPTTWATGLSKVVGASATLKAAATPGDDPSWCSVNFTGTDGNVDLYAYKNTSGTDPTLVASTNNTAVFTCIAVGY